MQAGGKRSEIPVVRSAESSSYTLYRCFACSRDCSFNQAVGIKGSCLRRMGAALFFSRTEIWETRSEHPLVREPRAPACFSSVAFWSSGLCDAMGSAGSHVLFSGAGRYFVGGISLCIFKAIQPRRKAIDSCHRSVRFNSFRTRTV